MKLLTLARDLRRRKARERELRFVAEGVRAVEELARSSLAPDGVLVAPQLMETPRGRALRALLDERRVPVAEVTALEFGTAAQTDSPQGVLAIALIPQRSIETLEVPARSRVLVLDAVQDPGNVGTIVRTAAALGVTATVALPGTVDVWNAKVVRSAMGAQFEHPALSASWSELDAFLARHAIALWSADTAGEPVDGTKAPARLALAVGNEGAGVSAETRARAARVVGLPLRPGVESLNVAVATGILLYELSA